MQMTYIEDRRLFVIVVTSCCYKKQELSCLKIQPFFLGYVLHKIPCRSSAAFPSLYGSVIVAEDSTALLRDSVTEWGMAGFSLIGN